MRQKPAWCIRQPLVCCNTAKGTNPLRLPFVSGREFCLHDVAIPRKGQTLCGPPARWMYLPPVEKRCNTAKGTNPLRLREVFIPFLRKVLLQYRERDKPFAAIKRTTICSIIILLQYRERDKPFAAYTQVDNETWNDTLQYRERDKPFAAPAFFSRYIIKAQTVSKIHRTLTVVKTSLCYTQYYHIFEK